MGNDLSSWKQIEISLPEVLVTLRFSKLPNAHNSLKNFELELNGVKMIMEESLL